MPKSSQQTGNQMYTVPSKATYTKKICNIHLLGRRGMSKKYKPAADMEKDKRIHKLGLCQNNVTQKSALIATNVNSPKNSIIGQKCPIVP